jgi:hypothetical protein
MSDSAIPWHDKPFTQRIHACVIGHHLRQKRGWSKVNDGVHRRRSRHPRCRRSPPPPQTRHVFPCGRHSQVPGISTSCSPAEDVEVDQPVVLSGHTPEGQLLSGWVPRGSAPKSQSPVAADPVQRRDKRCCSGPDEHTSYPRRHVPTLVVVGCDDRCRSQLKKKNIWFRSTVTVSTGIALPVSTSS